MEFQHNRQELIRRNITCIRGTSRSATFEDSAVLLRLNTRVRPRTEGTKCTLVASDSINITEKDRQTDRQTEGQTQDRYFTLSDMDAASVINHVGLTLTNSQK